MLWCWAWSRILITSIGVTTATASVIPAARPATLPEAFNCFYFIFFFYIFYPSPQGALEIGKGILPKKVACPLAAPAVLKDSACLYQS